MNRRKDLARQGKPFESTNLCLPSGGAAFWGGIDGIVIAFLPGKILLWNGLHHNGNDVRYVYTDGRAHDTFVDTYMGDSIGQWDGDTLVVDTIGFLPVVPAVSDIAMGGIANGGDMHMVERFNLVDHDTLKVDIEITAPNVLTGPFKLSRTFKRATGDNAEEHQVVCEADEVDKIDAQGLPYFDTTPPRDLVLPPGVTLN